MAEQAETRKGRQMIQVVAGALVVIMFLSLWQRFRFRCVLVDHLLPLSQLSKMCRITYHCVDTQQTDPSTMIPGLGEPREDLIDLLRSEIGRMVARQIDAGRADLGNAFVRQVASRMLTVVKDLARDQLEACHVELNRFFRYIPFELAIPVVIEIERKWPHHIETIPEANRRLDRIRKGGEYAVIFSPAKMRNLLICIEEIEEGQ